VSECLRAAAILWDAQCMFPSHLGCGSSPATAGHTRWGEEGFNCWPYRFGGRVCVRVPKGLFSPWNAKWSAEALLLMLAVVLKQAMGWGQEGPREQ
jgi:hypothetical protein